MLIVQKQFFCQGCNRRNLNTQGLSLILSNVSVQEIDEFEQISTTLKKLNCTDWIPLAGDDTSKRSVKIFCNNKKSVTDILSNHYERGLIIEFDEEFSLTIRVEPDSKNPIQRHKCNKPGHFKNSCNEERCPTCNEHKHGDLECTKPPCCAICG